jgi:hypothetical protein
MSINMIDANNYIFELLANFVQEKNTDIPINVKAIRCIDTNDEEKKWLKNLKIQKRQPISPTFRTASFEFNNEKYFVTVGWKSQSEIELVMMEAIDLNGGIITALLFELKVSIIKTANVLEIANEIFIEPIERITRYNFQAIEKFFEPILVYKIYEDCPFINDDTIDLIKLSSFYIIKNREIMWLDFTQETLSIFEKIFLEGSNNIPYENLMFSLVSVNWKYSFLDVYRCIERLFPICSLRDLHTFLKIEPSLQEFSIHIEDYIGWKAKEDKAIEELVKPAPPEAIRPVLKPVSQTWQGFETNPCRVGFHVIIKV